ncbi:MAG: hypothetical protein CFE28_07805 [Alphaproteobacteria bacterium PA2]|nr:MAG: hypothetical protein CFE28_07805 [Alphaproteobacteria bacterium PA2]
MSTTKTPADEGLAGFHAAVLNGLPEAVIVSTPAGEITFVNSATETLLGYGSAEVVGQPITFLVPRDPTRRADPVKWLSRWADEPDVAQSRFLDLTARRKDGGDLYVDVRVRHGEIAGQSRYFITVRDNTQLRRDQAAAREASLRAARILMVAEDAIVSIDADHRIVFFNPAAERMFGYSAESVTGQPLDILMPPDVREGHDRHIADFRAAKDASRMMSDRSRVMGLRRSGEAFPIEATITKIDVGGAVTFTAHIRDASLRPERT